MTADRVPLSVLIPVLNEAENIAAAIESVRAASEVVVVDSGSTDATCEIASAHGARVVQFNYEPGRPKKKTWAISNVPFSNQWVLILDADERVTPELMREIASVIGDGTSTMNGYLIDREYVFLGRSLRCFRPNWNLRLFRNGSGQMEDLGLHDLPDIGDNEVHEHVQVEGKVGYLSKPLLHRDYKNLSAWVDKHNRYATWEAHLYRQLRAEPLELNLFRLLRLDPFRRKRALRRIWPRLPFRPFIRFVTWYVFRQGFRDGRAGFVFCVLMANYEFLIGAKLGELEAQEEYPVSHDATTAASATSLPSGGPSA